MDNKIPGIFLLELFVHRLDVLKVVISPDELLLQSYGRHAVLGEEVCPAQSPDAVRGQERGGVVRVHALRRGQAETQETRQLDVHCSQDRGKNDNDASNTKYAD